MTTAIRNRLDAFQLVTEPDFESAYIDSAISFHLKPEGAPAKETILDPTHRVIRLASANKVPLSVTPESTLAQIITLMLSNDYSQLPVMTSPRELKGIVSWKTIGSRLALNRPCQLAKDCMEPAREIAADDSLFSAIGVVKANDYVLVRASDKIIAGIITATDLTEQFQMLSEPFLLVGEIENGVRRLLHGRFTKDELAAIKDPDDKDRVVEAISDLTFGEYLRLIEVENSWNKLGMAVDRVEFIKQLHRIREIRNDVMHFDPDGLDDADIVILREFSRFLKRLRDAGAA